MKKTIIALAALTATGAFAQSVTFDGVFDAGYQSNKYKGDSIKGFAGNGSSTSQLNVRGAYDLGDGLKADFRVETDWNTASNSGNTGAKKADGTVAATSAFGNGEIRGGLSGDFGRVDIGAVNNGQLDAFLTGQPFGTAFGSSFRGLYIADTSSASAVRFDNSARYLSPKFSGFSGSILTVAKQTKATGNNFSTTMGAYDSFGVNEFTLRYNAGPINAVFAVTKQDYAGVDSTAANGTITVQSFSTKLQTLGANYTFGDAKVFLLNQKRTKSDNSLSRTATTLSGSYMMGKNLFAVQIGSGKDSGTAGNDKSSKLFSLGYDYTLNKAAALYVRYENTKDEGGWVGNPAGLTAVAGETGRNRTALGMRIAF